MPQQDYQFIIFGGTGDLAHRKLLPAFYDLQVDGLLPENFSLITTGRRNDNREEYLEDVYKSLQENTRSTFCDSQWDLLKQNIEYLCFDIKNDEGYRKLKQMIDVENSLQIYYLALAPDFFSVVVDMLEKHNIVKKPEDRARLVIEKPFGSDLDSARKLNKRISEVFPEKNIYRIDHYLGKEMLQNILVIRFANSFFEPLWNNRYIDNVQIISTEAGGVGERGGYYDKAGALKDMVQNHMFQLLSMTAMEPPAAMDARSIRSEKVKIIKSLSEINPDNIDQLAVRGQYGPGTVKEKKVNGYRQENGIEGDSQTETFVAMKLFIDSMRWDGVPFYLKTGKRLTEKKTEIIVEFKSKYHPDYQNSFPELDPDLLIIRIQPLEGIFMQFNAKEPGTVQKIIPVKMDFCQNCEAVNQTPAAYEKLILDLFKGDATLFTRWDEVEYSWKFIDRVAQAWQDQKVDFPNYKSGSDGPQAAKKLLKNDNRRWWCLDCVKGDEENEN